MDSGKWLLIVSGAIILLLFTLLRPRGGPRKYPEIVQFILYDIKMNQALADTFLQRQKPKTFESNNWEINKTKIGFLTETQKELLKETFALVDKFNIEIKSAKKNKTDSYKNLDLSKFKELLARCQKELEDWMMTNIGQKELPLKYPSLTSFFFGER
jgi:predicted transcriptional regulator